MVDRDFAGQHAGVRGGLIARLWAFRSAMARSFLAAPADARAGYGN
jgi:hypothetical protein